MAIKYNNSTHEWEMGVWINGAWSVVVSAEDRSYLVNECNFMAIPAPRGSR